MSELFRILFHVFDVFDLFILTFDNFRLLTFLKSSKFLWLTKELGEKYIIV